MKVDLTSLSPVKRSMLIEVAPEEVQRETERVLRRYQQQARIPGFRPGKAPLSMIRARFAKELQEDVRERVVSRSYAEAAREKGLSPLGEPVVEDLKHEEGQALRFRTTFEVLPEIQPQAYKQIEVRRTSAAVDDQEVAQALDQLREQRAQLVTEEGRMAQQGDVIVADIEGLVQDGQPFHRERMMIEVGAADNLPAFNEGLLNVTAGSERSFAVDYPRDYRSKDLAGRRVNYRAQVHEVKSRRIPALDDEFARDLGEFESLEALRIKLRQDLEQRKARQVEHALRQSLIDKLLLQNPVVLPDVLVEQEVRHRLEDLVRSLVLQGVDPSKVELDWKELRRRQDEPARKTVHTRLMLDAVARAESLSVTDEELENRIRQEALRSGESALEFRAKLQKHDALEALKSQVIREKSLDYLTAVANIQVGE